MERCGFKCIGCGSENNVSLEEVFFYNEEGKKIGGGSVFLCPRCFLVFYNIKQHLISKGNLTKFVKDVKLGETHKSG